MEQTKNIIIAALVVAVGLLGVWQFAKPDQTGFLSAEEAGELALTYINETLLNGETQASLSGEVEEESGVYKLPIEVEGNEFFFYVSKDGKIFFVEGMTVEEKQEQEQELTSTIGNFSKHENEVCQEDDKPIIYFFGSQGCGYCQWEHPVVEEVAQKFEGYISFHNNMDSEEDLEVFSEYSTGGIPTLVLGCKYSRVGAGTNFGEEVETDNLTALICDLTGGEPTEACELVSDLLNNQ